MIATRTILIVAALVAVLLGAGCSGGVVLEPTEGPVLEVRKIARARTITEDVTSVEPGNPAEIALGASQLFFDSAQVVVLASATENASITRAASIAVTLGTPLLLTAPPGENLAGQALTDQGEAPAQAGSLNNELLRLGTRAVITVGEVSLHQLDTTSLVVAPIGEGDGDLAKIIDHDLTPIPIPARADAMAGLAALEAGQIYQTTGLGPSPTSYGTLPKTLPAARNSDTAVLTGRNTRYFAGVATARAAGARVIVSEDPGASTAVIDHFVAHPLEPVVGLGENFLDVGDLEGVVAALRVGALLPSGSQRIFRHDGEDTLVLTVDADAALQRRNMDNAEDVLDFSRRRAASFADARGAAVSPGVEILARPSGLDDLAYWVQRAHEADQYVVLRVRPKGDVREALSPFESLLRHPGVGVRLDLSSSAEAANSTINAAEAYLRELSDEEHGPQTLLLVDLGSGARILADEPLASSTRQVALAVSVDEATAESAWRTLQESVDESIFLAVGVPPATDGDGTSAGYPAWRDVLGFSDVDLLTLR